MQQLGHQFSQRDRSLALARDIRPQGAPVHHGLDVRLPLKPAAPRARAQHTLDAVASVHGDGNLPKIPVGLMPARGDGHGEYEFDTSTGDPLYIRIKAENGAADPLNEGTMPELALAHEIGHFLDNRGLPGPFFESNKPTVRKMRLLMRTIRRSATYQEIAKAARAGGVGTTYWRYLRHRNEIFARAYAQYIAWRSGSPVLREQIDAILDSNDDDVKVVQWPYEEFLPIVEAFDVLFEELGWLTRN